MPEETPAHDQKEVKTYTVHYPSHYPREKDPHYNAFEAYRKSHVADAKCYVGERIGTEHCKGGLELHHHYIEFAVTNDVSIQAIEKDFPEVTDEEKLQEFVESDENFMWLCAFHHRGGAGVHTVSAADFEAGMYAPDLFD